MSRELKSRVGMLKNLKKVQGADGNWDFDPYMHGLYNGIELALSVLEMRESEFRHAPEQWSKDKQSIREPTITREVSEIELNSLGGIIL